MRIDGFHNRIANYIAKSPRIQKILRKVDANPSLFNGMVAFGIAVTLKPATILLTPSKNKENKKDNTYGVARSISTGFADLAIAYGIFLPLNKHIDEIGRELFNNKKHVCYQNKELTSNAKSLINRGSKIALIPLFAFLKFFFIEPIAKRLKRKSNSTSKLDVKV